jgi:hypothetical protein
MYIPNLPEPDVPDDEGEPVGPPRKKFKKRFGITLTHTYCTGNLTTFKTRTFVHKLWYAKERDRDMAYAAYNRRVNRFWKETAEKIER